MITNLRMFVSERNKKLSYRLGRADRIASRPIRKPASDFRSRKKQFIRMIVVPYALWWCRCCYMERHSQR